MLVRVKYLVIMEVTIATLFTLVFVIASDGTDDVVHVVYVNIVT
jgi:hypothetical protein